mgnify:CR=1 FL=1
MKSDAMMQIGELAKRANTTTKTLRYYERIGLLPPTVRGANRYRLYAPEALGRVRFIRRAKQMGLTLDEVTTLIVIAKQGEGKALQKQLKKILSRKIRETEAQIQSLIQFRQDLQTLSAQLDESFLAQCNTCGALFANCDCTTPAPPKHTRAA